MNLHGGESAEKLGDNLVVPYLEKPSGRAAAAKKPASDSSTLNPSGRSIW